ncbi:MAG: beta-lactamase family protein [Defluviitaleaceae bacterium]|nr:beta-lactamase family protein [Defluviitaleaceae bacterium]
MKNRKTSKIVTLLMLVCLLMPTLAMFASQAIISNEAERHILGELNRANIPKATIAVIQNGETSYILKDSQHDTLFQIGSVSKSFTGFGVLLLEDMGLLSVSDSVNQHLPWFTVNYNGVPVPHGDITIYTLLQHSSGFTSDERRFPASYVTDLNRFISQVTGAELAFYPSHDHVYGNINYVILGLVIKSVSGQSYDDFMTESVLYPLGLYNTFANVERARATGRTVSGHRYGFFRPRATDAYFPTLSIPTGGIYSSISDMARWAGIHLGTIEINEQFARIVQRSHENNHTAQNPFADTNFHPGAGWNILHDDSDFGNLAFDDMKIMHGGSGFGNIAYIGIIPERDMAVIFLLNHRHMNVPAWIFMIWDALDGVFNPIGTDLFAIFDIVFVAITAVGVLFIGMFVRLIVKVNKQLPNEWRAKPTLKIRWLIVPIFSIIGVLIFHVVMPMLFIMPLGILLLFSPASAITAIIAMWVMAVYSLFSLWTKAFVNQR